MTDNNQLYNEIYINVKRKQELVESLKQVLDAQMQASETLDKKAWDILSVTSAVFGIVGALEVTLKGSQASPWFWLGLAFIGVLYFCQVTQVLYATTPMIWFIVPSSGDGGLDYQTLMTKYIPVDENIYLDKLIIDYAGTSEAIGAIQQARNNNATKSNHIRNAALLLTAIIIALVGVAILISFNPPT